MKGIMSGNSKKRSDRGTDQKDQNTQTRTNTERSTRDMANSSAGTNQGTSQNPSIITSDELLKRLAEADAIEKPKLEVVEQDEPIKAYRSLRIIAGNHTIGLISYYSSHGAFGVNETKATCQVGVTQGGTWSYDGNIDGIWSYSKSVTTSTHTAPDDNCECGFYGVKDIKDCPIGSTFIAEVEFYGDIVEYEQGYRAEYQRVLSITVDVSHCTGKLLCMNKPEKLIFGNRDGNDPKGKCNECAGDDPRAVTLEQIAGRLGVEVKWKNR